MPKCLDCGNTKLFWYDETGHKLGEYDEKGYLQDVVVSSYADVENGECNECSSKNIEGAL